MLYTFTDCFRCFNVCGVCLLFLVFCCCVLDWLVDCLLCVLALCICFGGFAGLIGSVVFAFVSCFEFVVWLIWLFASGLGLVWVVVGCLLLCCCCVLL